MRRPRIRGATNSGALAIVALLVTGCTVGPDYVRPDAPTSAAFKGIDGWKTAAPRAEAPRGSWWKVFGDPDLDALERQVDIGSQTIQAAEARVRAAQAATEAARAGLFPAVGGNAGAVRSARAAASGAGSPPPANSYNVAIDLSWEVDLWGRVRRGVEASDAAAQATAADLAAARLSVEALLAQTYFLLRVEDAQIRLLQDTVAGYEKSLQLTRNQYAAGIVGRGDVAQAQTQLKSAQAQELDARLARAQLENAIAVLIGKPPAELAIPARAIAATFPAIPATFPSELLERRPDIAAAERRVASANAEIGVAQAAFYPSLNLAGVGGAQNSALGSLVSLPSRYWSLGAGLAQPLFDAGLRSAQKAQAIAVYDETVAAYRSTVLTAFQEVEDNLAALALLEQEAAVQDEATKSARESATIAANQYKAGTVTYIVVVVLQAAALNNERAALAILGRRLTASVALIKALGGGWNASALARDPAGD
jgi:NodT family efflux transporter outer membrane factor (OMF) lipoprotein